jgi:hypothetical protein
MGLDGASLVEDASGQKGYIGQVAWLHISCGCGETFIVIG